MGGSSRETQRKPLSAASVLWDKEAQWQVRSWLLSTEQALGRPSVCPQAAIRGFPPHQALRADLGESREVCQHGNGPFSASCNPGHAAYWMTSAGWARAQEQGAKNTKPEPCRAAGSTGKMQLWENKMVRGSQAGAGQGLNALKDLFYVYGKQSDRDEEREEEIFRFLVCSLNGHNSWDVPDQSQGGAYNCIQVSHMDDGVQVLEPSPLFCRCILRKLDEKWQNRI